MMKILVIGPSWIGDTVMSHSMYQLLVMRYNGRVEIDVLIPKKCHAIVNYMSEINKVLFLPYTHGVLGLRKILCVGKFLRNEKYQQAIILPNSFKSALIPFFADIAIRTGWRGEMRYGILNDLRVLNSIALPLMVQRYAALAYDHDVIQSAADFLYSLPWPSLNIKKTEVEKVLFKFNLYCYQKWLIGLCFGAEFGPAKIWPHYHYIKLAIYLVNCGYYVVILGCANKSIICKFFANSVLKDLKKYCINIINQTSLHEAIAIISVCRGIVSSDSGLLHIACALQRAVVGLYGPTDPGFTPPLSNQVVVLRGIDKYYKIRSSNDSIYGYHHSLINIRPHQVLQALQKLLKNDI